MREHGSGSGLRRIQIVTDSKYVHENSRWAEYWRANGWRNASGRPIENPDLWKELLSIRTELRVRTDIEWTLGKRAPILKAVDKSAKSAAKQPTETDRGYQSGKVGRTKNKVSGSRHSFRLPVKRLSFAFTGRGRSVAARTKQLFRCSRKHEGISLRSLSHTRGLKFVPSYAGIMHIAFGSSDAKYPVIEAVVEDIG